MHTKNEKWMLSEYQLPFSQYLIIFFPEKAQRTYLTEFDKYFEQHEKDISYCQPVIRVAADLES